MTGQKRYQQTIANAEQVYLFWFNNYLTVEKYAKDYDIPLSVANKLVELGRAVHFEKIEEDVVL